MNRLTSQKIREYGVYPEVEYPPISGMYSMLGASALIDQPRYTEWVRLSQSVGRIEPFMIVAIQGLGRLDALLVAQDQVYLSLPEAKSATIDAMLDLTDRFTNSCLWVLGAYEIIRTIDQRFREDPTLACEATVKVIRATKHQFERVRIPLAKFEPARRFSDSHSSVAFPAIHLQDGVAWRVAENVIVSRRELSESFMTMLRTL